MVENIRSKNPYFIPVNDYHCEEMYYRMHDLYIRGKKLSARLYKFLMWRLFYTFIPPEVKIGKRVIFGHHGFGIVMHEDTIIGDDAIILQHTTFGNGNIRIGNCFTIGAGAVIIGPLSIGDYVTIAPNAFVNSDIPSNALVIGNPGKIIKIRTKEDLEQIKQKRVKYFE